MIASLSPNELKRLETLEGYNILDTLPENAFDRLTTLAASMFDVPIALVTLIDRDRQWFKSKFGLQTSETPLDVSFCAHTILKDSVLVIPDASTDARFKDNNLVTGSPHIRFYAGAPLKASNGHNIGTFCIIDTVARDFDPAQQAILQDLAAVAMDELELRRISGDLRENEAILQKTIRNNSQLSVAIQNLTSGVVITDPSLPDNPIIFANPAFYSISGYGEDEIIGSNCRFLQGADTDPVIVQDLRSAVAERRPFSGLLVNYRKDGEAFVNELTVNPVFDAQGNLLNFVGLQNDVTARVRAEQAMVEAQAATELANQTLEQRVQERTAELAQSQMEILTRLALAAEFRDDDTGRHTQRVGQTSMLLAKALGMSEHEQLLIRQAAPLHDVGKIAISDLILLKPGKLTDEEFAIMKTHAAAGAALLAGGNSEVVLLAERIAGGHHEKWNGTGYPHQLTGTQIPFEAAIVSVADVFDALTHERPYKKAWPVADAVAEIGRLSGISFDAKIIKAFLTLSHEDLVDHI